MRISDWSSDVCSSDLLRRFPEADAGPQRAHHRRGRDTAGLDVGGDADAAQLALGFGGLAALRKALVVDHLQGLVHRLVVVADVVLQGEIGRESRRGRVCQYVWSSVGAVSLNKKKK